MDVLTNMAGNVWKINVKEGDQVSSGQEIIILESMKMEIPVAAENDGEVETILVNEGDFINDGDVIIKLR